mgnify:CR=1 FL=1
MALRNLLVHIDGTRACDRREDAAIAFAAEHDAHLAALYCVGELHFEGWAEWPMDVVEEQASQAHSSAEAVVERFRGKAERAGISHETRVVRTRMNAIADRVALHARYADLAILGQVDPDEPPAGGAGLVEHVLLGCGRPVLVIPYIGAPGRGSREGVAFGRDVAVAWDAGREATRAVNDALPILERAGRVTVVAVNPAHGPSHHGEEPGADIALHLSRHDIGVEVQRLDTTDLSPADTLLAHVSDAFNDLLVMGGYGHSRMREIVLGGATRHVLEQMTVPVLMSH